MTQQPNPPLGGDEAKVVMAHSALTRSIPGEGQPVSNSRLAAELQAVALGIRMFGLNGFSNMLAERVQEATENEQVKP